MPSRTRVWSMSSPFRGPSAVLVGPPERGINLGVSVDIVVEFGKHDQLGFSPAQVQAAAHRRNRRYGFFQGP